MSVTDDDRNRDDGGDQTAHNPVRKRNRQIAIGAVGLAAVLGTGAYFVTDSLTDKGTTTATEAASPAPVVVASGSAAATSAGASAEPSAVASVRASAPPSALPKEVEEKIKEARRKMAEDGVPIKRPVLPKTTATAENIEMTTKGSLKEGGIVRVLAAREDLTGQRELAYVAGGVEKYRKTLCSQTFQFSTNPKPAKKDNLVICWRTTAAKSVVAMVVDPKGKPSRDKAVDALEKKWRSMG